VVGRDEPVLSEAERVEPTNIHQALRIGCVKYLNARPLIHGWTGEVTLDHPAALCAQLARRDLDVALVSSFEFLRNPIYRIVDDISISSAGPVYSVIVAHQGEISEADKIELDPAAETSVNLLRCLLSESQLNPRFTRTSASSSASPARTRHARLLIGDQAIHFRQEHAQEFRFWDLGEQWARVVGFPFVYALWLIQPDVTDAKTIADRLRALRDKNLANIDKLIAEEKDFNREFCVGYYRENLRFDFGKEEKQGLTEFHKRCVELRLLPRDGLGFGTGELELARRCV
jgi:predicted solute-binding protein